MKFLGKSKKELVKYKSTRELPIMIWHDIHQNKDVRLLSDKVEFKDSEILKLSDAWENLVNEYFEKHGLPDELESFLEARKKSARFKFKYIMEGKRHYLTMAEIELQSINFNDNLTNKKTLQENLALLSKSYGFKLSGKETTVDEYYSYIKALKNGRG